MLRIIVGDPATSARDAGGRILEAPGVRAFATPVGPSATVRSLAAQAGWERADCYLQRAAERHPLPLDALAGDVRLALAPATWDGAGRLLRLLAPVADAVLVDPSGRDALARMIGAERVVEALLDDLAPPPGARTAPTASRELDVLVLRGDAADGAAERALAALAAGGVALRIEACGHASAAMHATRARLVVAPSAHGEAPCALAAAAAAGACLLVERGNPTLPTILRPELDYATFGDDLVRVVGRLLGDDAERLAIAAAGQAALGADRGDERLLAALAALGDRLARLAPRRAPGGRHAARLLAEQRRLCGVGSGDAAALLADAGCPTAEVRRLAALVAVEVEAAGADAATAWALAAAPESPDAGLLLARADAAAAAGLPADRAWAAQAALHAAADGIDCSLPVPDDPEWRGPLEHAIATAGDDASARHVAARWARARAGWHLAVAARASLPPARRLALLGPRADDPLPVRRERADALLACGRLDEAHALLAAIAAGRPAAGRAEDATAAAVALTWCSGPDLVGALALRAAGHVPGDVLRVLAVPADAPDARELLERGAPPGVELHVLPGDAAASLRAVTDATCVIARTDAPEALLARAAGVPVLDPTAPPSALAAAA